jgi:dihydroorotase
MDLKDEGRFKMNPPIRSEEDRLALIEGIKDGTIDMIATDHAPHSLEEKSKGLKGSMMGVVGLETAFPVLYTELVKNNIITLEKLIELMSINPRKRFGIKDNGFSVWNLDKKYTVNPQEFFTMGRATPFENKEVFGECVLTVVNGETVYRK